MSYTDPIWEHVIENRDQIATLHHEYKDLSRRVGDMERKFRKIRPNLCLEVLGVLREIGSLKEWIIGISLLALLLKGSISPADIKSIFLSTHGGE